jgi:hypothetical protein
VTLPVVVNIRPIKTAEEIIYRDPAVETLGYTVDDLEVGVAVGEQERCAATGVFTCGG